MRPTIALSTCWCSHRHVDGFAMIREMVDLGFSHVELSHGIRVSLVPGILKAVKEGLTKISSVHNFCPLPTGVLYAAPNLYEPTASDPNERSSWLRHSRRTIDFAVSVGCERVVLHLGSVKFLWRDPARKLERHLGSSASPNENLDRMGDPVIEKVIFQIRKKAAAPVRRMRASIDRLMPYAQEKGVKLGVENREGIIELPLDQDLAQLIGDYCETDSVYYWHDSGHAQLKERMGIYSHEQLLLENRQHLMGFHLHDVSEKNRDHQPLGSGTIAFESLKDFFAPDQVLVLELSPRLEVEQVLRSLDYLNGLLEE